MNLIFYFISVLFSLVVILQSNAQPADPKPDPATAAVNATKDAVADISKALNGTKNALNPADVAKKGTGLIASLIAACQQFITSVISLFTGASKAGGSAGIPGVDVASQFLKAGQEIIATPIKLGTAMAESAVKMISPSSASAPANKTASASVVPNPVNIISNVEKAGADIFGGIFGAFG